MAPFEQTCPLRPVLIDEADGPPILAHREIAPHSIGSELAAMRLDHRIARLELALRELRRQAHAHRANHTKAPDGLVRAMRGFEMELAAARAAAGEPVEDPGPARTAGAT